MCGSLRLLINDSRFSERSHFLCTINSFQKFRRIAFFTMLCLARGVRRSRSSQRILLQWNAASNEREQHSAAAVRSQFLDFFVRDKDHTHIRASPVVPFNDPSLMFVNAGMNQFKSVLQVPYQSSEKYIFFYSVESAVCVILQKMWGLVW